MNAATHPTVDFFAATQSGPLLVSVLIHGVLLAALVISFERGSRYQVPPSALAIQAVVVDKSVLDKAMRRPPVVDPEAQRRQQAERDRQAQLEQQAREAREAEAARQAQELRQAEQQRAAEVQRKADAARQLEAERKAEAAREARAAEEAVAARKAEAARQAEAQRQAQVREAAAEKARQTEAVRQAAIRSEIEANERALMTQMQAEEAYMSAAQSGLLDEYVALIAQKVERNWLKPPGTAADLDCEVRVTQIPGGEVVDVRIVKCNGDAATTRSIEAAVYKASPLPLPADPSLFERNLTFIFDPEE